MSPRLLFHSFTHSLAFISLSLEPCAVNTTDSLAQLSSHNGGLSDTPGDGASHTALLEHQQSADGASARGADFFADESGMLAVLDEARGAAHGLRCHQLGLCSGQAHGDGAVGEGFQHEGKEGRAGATQRGGHVHHGGREMHDAADPREDPVDQRRELGGQGGSVGRDDGHGLAHQGGGVGHDADEPACVVGEVGRVVLAVQHAAHLLDGDAGADGDEQLAGQCFLHALLQQDVRHHVRLAAQDDDVGGLDAPHVLVLQHRHARPVVLHSEFDALGRLGPPHARDEVRGCSLRRAFCGGRCGAGVWVRGRRCR